MSGTGSSTTTGNVMTPDNNTTTAWPMLSLILHGFKQGAENFLLDVFRFP